MDVSRGEEDRPWDELIPEALALIFNKMSLEEVLTMVPAVCKSWRKAAMLPDCWQEIDLDVDWCLSWCDRSKPENVDRMVKMLVSRSRGCMRELSVWKLTNDSTFAFIAEYAQGLQTLLMPMSAVTDSIVIQVAPKLATVTYLDISHCEKMTSSSLEALGKHCKFLRNWDPFATVGQSPNDDEAFAIAKYMCGLKHLELFYGPHTNAGMKAILSMSKELERLDIRGCENAVMQDSQDVQCRKLKFFVPPLVDDESDYDNDYG